MIKFTVFTLLLVLIVSTTLIKNSTKDLDDQIYSIRENILFLEDRFKDSKLEFKNKCSGNYSSRSYNFVDATKNNIIYPSLDPSIFELKYPNQDIKGRII